MKLKMFKSIWGMPGNWESQLKQISEAGYTGIESWLPATEDVTLFKELLVKYNLELILQVYTAGNHSESLEEQVERATTFNPLLINAHSVKDSMPYEDQLIYFERAIALEKHIGIPIAHETHRGRATFTPWSTARLLRDLPELHITADFSHWCCVCESMLDDQIDNIKLAIQHTIHTHARVGYEQGPQVPDFRAPEYQYALQKHEQWWDEIIQTHLAAGKHQFTFTPEFGPPGYMHTLPFTNQPVVDLWDVCLAMGHRFQERFNNRS